MSCKFFHNFFSRKYFSFLKSWSNSVLFSIVGLFLLISLFPFETQKTSAVGNVQPKADDSIITLIVTAAGDAMAHMPQIQAAYDGASKTYDFNSVFTFIKPFLQNSDLNIVNFETNLAGEPYSGYPKFSAPDSFAQALLNVGFNFIIHANNHAADKDYDGLIRTLKFFDNKKIAQAGIYANDSQRKANYPYILNIKGIKIGMLNYTYGTNGNSVSGGAVINYINHTAITNDLARLQDSLCDIIIACMHWGTEYERLPDAYQIKTERFLLENGVNIIIGSHPHVIQPAACDTITRNQHLDTALVYWSLGNFVSNQRQQYTDGGIMARFLITKNLKTHKTTFAHPTYIPYWVYRTDDMRHYTLLPVLQFERDSLYLNKMKPQLKADFFQFVNDTRRHLEGRDSILKEWKP
ncbi:MAG: CapA family protein [Bacteroidota bacterium]